MANAPLTCNLEQAAALLHAHPSTVRELANAGEIPGRKVGRAWVFVTADLIAYVRAGPRHRTRQEVREGLPPLSRDEMDAILQRVKDDIARESADGGVSPRQSRRRIKG